MRRDGKKRRQESGGLEERLEALQGVPRYRKRTSRVGATIFGFLLVGCVLAIVYVIYVAAIGGGGEDRAVSVTVEEGDSLSVVADKLQGAGVIQSATAFKIETRVEGAGTALKPGNYEFRTGAESAAIIDKLTAGQPVSTFEITVPEGLTLEQTSQTVAEQSGVKAKAFEDAAKKTNYGYAFLENPDIKNTEGFLFPKQYEFEEGTSAPQVVNRMLEQYFIETQNLDLSNPVEGLDLTEYEIVTVASLIEREAANDEERPLVASVIYNRLRDDMPLQIDATIQYARGEPKAALSLEDLEIDSPYNTYQNPGLPPGPIASPSLQSLKAAVSPAETDYLYYVLKGNGQEHFFTNDYDEFLKAKEKAGR
ncbi:MAG: endolytic transglycosylase MltG [Rubrobacteraceae bacterium]